MLQLSQTFFQLLFQVLHLCCFCTMFGFQFLFVVREVDFFFINQCIFILYLLFERAQLCFQAWYDFCIALQSLDFREEGLLESIGMLGMQGLYHIELVRNINDMTHKCMEKLEDINMIQHNLKYRSRASSSSSGSDKILSAERIQALVNKTLQRKDLFEKLLEQSSMAEQQCCNRTTDDLNLSPRQQPQQQGCKCTKIDCLKLYCECFAKGKLCNQNCVCVCCNNKPGNEEEITRARSVVNYRQPGYFQGVPEHVPTRKCTCKKSGCRKKYCECFNAGLKCTEECECCNCHNGKPYIKIDLDSRMEVQVR